MLIYIYIYFVCFFEMSKVWHSQSVIKNEPHFWWGGWTHVQRTRVEPGAQG